MNDPTETARRAMLATGQPQADLEAEVTVCKYCRKILYEFEGGLYAREPEPGTASGVCLKAPSGPDPQHPLYPSHAVGQTWATSEVQKDFEVLGFMAPFVVVRRRSDGKKGSLEFTHSPRVYFGFREDEG